MMMINKSNVQELDQKTIKTTVVDESIIQALSARLVQMQPSVELKKQKIILIIEGPDSLLKEQFIQQLQQSCEPAFIQHYNTEKMRDKRVQWHFQPLIAHLPEAGQITIFDRCWHSHQKHKHNSSGRGIANQTITQIELALKTAGYKIIKYWFQSDPQNYRELVQAFVDQSINNNVKNVTEELNIQSSNNNILSITYKTELPWNVVGGHNVFPALTHLLDQLNIQDLSFTNPISTPLFEGQEQIQWSKSKTNILRLDTLNTSFPIATEIQEAITTYTQVGILADGPKEGLDSFREAAAQVMTEKRGVTCSADQILPIEGTTTGIFTAMQFLLRPGEEALVMAPVDQVFQQAIEARGGKMIIVPLDPKNGKLDTNALAKAITPKTKVICLGNPYGSRGRVLRWNELFEIGKIALQHQLWILNDESWAEIIYSPHHHFNIGSLHQKIAARTISVYGFAKSFGLADLRIGFIAAPSTSVYEQLKQVSKSHSRNLPISTLSQRAATAAFTDGWHWIEAYVDHLQNMRDYSVQRLNQIRGIQCNSPEGTNVIMIDITKFGMNCEQMSDYLLQNANVAVMPGTTKWSGPTAKGYIGLCFSTSKEILEEAFDRIEKAINALPRYQKLNRN